MLDDPQNKYLNMELDQKLLSTPFKTQTKWIVITGAACSGKTTLIDMLAERDFKTVPEAGRTFFNNELAKGRTIEEIREEQTAITLQIYEIMLNNERNLPAHEVAFLDRALPDGFAFLRFTGINPNSILLDCFQYHYAKVFLLNRLPYQQDGVRVADDPTAAYYESWTLRDYAALGYDVIRVPVLPPEERLEFVLDRIPTE